MSLVFNSLLTNHKISSNTINLITKLNKLMSKDIIHIAIFGEK